LAESRKVANWQKRDAVMAIALGVGTVLSRLPFQIDILNNHDAVNYALALDHFDMRLHQPQPPGYPLYIILGRAFNLVFHDHLAALVWLSTVFSGLAVSRRVGLVAALLLATSSVFWFQGEIAAPYTADLFASVMVGWLCYRLVTSSGRGVVWSTALAVGLAGALRLQTIAFLFPLFLYALRRRHWKTIGSAIILAGGVFGLFFIPAVIVSGGPRAFMRSMRVIVPIFWSTKTLIQSAKWSRFVHNADTIGRYVLRTLGEFALPFVLVGYLTRSQRLRFWRNSKLFFLVVWVLPTWIVYFLIWPGNLGTILCMPPLFLLAAVGLDWVMARPRWGTTVGWASLVVLLAWRIAIFTILPQYPFGEHYRRFDNHETVDSIADYYRVKLSLVSEVPEYRTFSPPSLRRSDPTIVKSIVSIENGEMEVWNMRDVTTLIPPETERIVFFDLPPEILLADQALVEERSENGYTIQIISVPPNYKALWTLEGLSLNVHE